MHAAISCAGRVLPIKESSLFSAGLILNSLMTTNERAAHFHASDVDLSHKRAELVSILKRCLEKKAVTLMNHPKSPEVPPEAYDLAVRCDYEMVKRNGHPVPVYLSEPMKKTILKLDWESQRRRLRIYAQMREKEELDDEITLRKLENQRKKHDEFARRIREELPEMVGKGFHDDAGRHVLGPRMCLDGAIHKSMERTAGTAAGNLLFALRFGQNFVIDLALPYAMEEKEVRSLHSQMKEIYRVNQWMWEPFNIHLCGYNPDNRVMRNMVSSCNDFLWHVTPECFTRVFPREKLVYLSPDSPNILKEYSHNDIYILGALIDKRIPKKYSYNKAQELGIRSARLDLGDYLELTRQKLPYLAFSDVFNVMVDARDTDGNWFYAFKNLITGRKRIFRWRDELEVEPEPASTPPPDPLSALKEDFKLKHLEKERAMVKPRIKPVASELTLNER